jgi:hypothetical protein
MSCYSKNFVWKKRCSRFLVYVFSVRAKTQMFGEQIMYNKGVFSITVNTKVTENNYVEEKGLMLYSKLTEMPLCLI